jgi:alpha-mannosidase
MSFVRLSPSNLILTTVKKAEDSDAWIMQWYDQGGVDCEAKIELSRPPKRILLSNFLEEDGEPIRALNNTATIPTKRNSIITLKVTY